MSTRGLERPSIKAALVIGFGLTFALWLLAGYRFTRRMVEVQAEASTINARYMHSQELLTTVRTQVLLGSVYVRDALLDPDPKTVVANRVQLDKTYQSIAEALDQYEPVLDSSAERDRFARLRREIDGFRVTMLDVLASDSSRWPAEARILLQTQVVPKRELVIGVSEEVQSLNRAAFVRQQEETALIYGDMQRSVWLLLGLALAASLAIGLLATRYALRLERQNRLQIAREQDTARDLQRLSSALISAQEDERRTIARELHDEVGQTLTAVKVELAIAQRSLGGTPEGMQAIESARSFTDSTLQTVRDLSHLLHPSLLDDLGLPAAVDWYLKGVGRRHEIRVELLENGMESRMAPETESAAFRIIQEALTNVVKHAQATTARIYLQRLPNTVLITVEDNGVGFDPESELARTGRGLGLIGIRERAAYLLGTVRLESVVGKGTRLTVELPAPATSQTTDSGDESVRGEPELMS